MFTTIEESLLGFGWRWFYTMLSVASRAAVGHPLFVVSEVVPCSNNKMFVMRLTFRHDETSVAHIVVDAWPEGPPWGVLGAITHHNG